MEMTGRLCVFVQGDANTGKNYAVKKALQKMGVNYFYLPKRNQTLKGIREKDSIFVDGGTPTNLPGMVGEFRLAIPQEDGSEANWSGECLVVTSDVSLKDWVASCGITDEEEYKDVKRAFFQIRLEKSESSGKIEPWVIDAIAMDMYSEEYRHMMDKKFGVFCNYFKKALNPSER